MNEEKKTDMNEQPGITGESVQIVNIQIRPNGPIVITTDCHITLSNGEVEIRKGTTTLCRCGASEKKPYCDGSHRKINFVG